MEENFEEIFSLTKRNTKFNHEFSHSTSLILYAMLLLLKQTIKRVLLIVLVLRVWEGSLTTKIISKKKESHENLTEKLALELDWCLGICTVL